MQPYTVHRTRWKGCPAELVTFTGTTSEEYDVFLDARFAEGREPVGWRTDAGAPYVQIDGRMQPCQYRRLIVGEEGEQQ